MKTSRLFPSQLCTLDLIWQPALVLDGLWLSGDWVCGDVAKYTVFCNLLLVMVDFLSWVVEPLGNVERL